ncbi:MAG: hypothetical protein HRU02_00905, partial [Myxococcales bacterium]|nr:hypothetical protein [Myxococcales bacterium]
DFDDAGNFVVVWGGDDGDLDGVYGQHFDAGGNPVGSEFRVNTTTVGDQHAPSVARDGPGNTLIVWVGEVPDFDITDRGIFGQFYDTTGAAVGGEFRLNSTTLDIQTTPVVSVNASGEFVVTWESRDTDAGDVFGQRLELQAGPIMDADGDGWTDASDNCVLIPNAGTLGCDSDKDGYGNACDGDFNNDGTSDGVDFSPLFLADFASGAQSNNAAGDPQGTDMNCDGLVDGVDFVDPFFLTQFGLGTPGPSGIGCAGSVPCPAAPGP